MIKPLGAAAAAITVLAIAACGSSGPASYLASGSSYVDFIQWETTSGSSVQGTMTVDTASGTAPAETISASRYPFTGTINGSSVTFTFSGFLTSGTIYGTLNGGTLPLQVPQSDGSIQAGTLTQSDTSTYNSAVTALNQRVRHANVLAAAAQAQAQQQQQNAQAEQTASGDVSTLQQDTSFGADLGSLQSDVQQASSDLGTVRSDASQGKGSFCDNVYSVSDDAYSVDDDLYSLSSDLDTLTNDIASARQDIRAVRQDLANLSASGLPAPTGATAAVAAARQAIQQAKTTANGYIGQANADDTTAYATANGLATGSCSGQGPGSTSALLKHI